MELSIYQRDIIDKIVNGHSNIMIQSYAGCGKTSTLIEIMKILDEKSTKLYCAFNKDIVKDISCKTSDINNLSISTIHSIGYRIVQRNNESNVTLDEFKYINEFYKNVELYSSCFSDLSRNDQQKYLSNIKRLSVFCRNNLCDGIKGITRIAQQFGVVTIGDELLAVKELLSWGKKNTETIDYTDMVWLPNVLPYRFPHYDYVFVDEAQDLSIAQQQIVLKCRNIRTRYIFCGDKYQSIYAFSGADAKSFDNLASTPNTETMTLPICYRCDDAIVDFASQIVNGIQRNGFTNKGNLNFNGTIENIKNGDIVLCRNNAPLIKLYLKLISIGKKCTILGKEWSDDLIEILNNVDSNLIGADLNPNGIISEMYKQLFKTVDYICETEKCDTTNALNSQICRNIVDKINTILILSNNIETKDKLIERINDIYNDEENIDSISLSTIHKAKGLEYDNVHILCWSLFDDNIKRMEMDWEKNQEINLKYVAITRARHSLSIIKNDYEYTQYSSYMSVDEYESIKRKISFLETHNVIRLYDIVNTDTIKPLNLNEINNNNEQTNDSSILNKLKKLKKRK